MDFITNKISIDLMAPAELEVIHAVQGERYVRRVQISLLCDGAPWQIPKGTLLAVRYGGVLHAGGYYDTLPDGTSACSYDGNTVTIILTPQMMHTAGYVMTQVELCHGDQLLATFSFKLLVALNPAVGILEPETYINWLQWMENQLKERIEQLAEKGELTGPEGPQGAPAEVSDVEVVYQAATSADVMPTETWSGTVPCVPAGQYLWTKTTIWFNHVSPVTFYSVARMGIDGTGSVVSVAGISPDENGNVPLTADHIGALPIAGGTMTGPIDMNCQKLTGLNTPEEDTEAATRGYTLGLVKKAAPMNLLDNSDFTNPVNQRGQDSYTSAGYMIDRWKSSNAHSVLTIEDGYVNFAATTGNAYLRQTFEKAVDGIFTAVICVRGTGSGAVYLSKDGASAGTGVLSFQAVHEKWTCFYAVFDTASGTSPNQLSIRADSGKNFDIKYVALYEGDFTAESLPVYQPKGYGAELAECQRYYLHFKSAMFCGIAFATSSTTMRVAIPTPVTMRTIPTIFSEREDFQLSARINGKTVRGDTWTTDSCDVNNVRITLTGTDYETSMVGVCYPTGDFGLSADL